MDRTAQAVYNPSLALLRVLQAQSNQALGATATATKGSFEKSVSDIAQEQQARGVDFKGFSPDEYNRYFGASAAPALATLDSGVNDTRLQLAQVLNNLKTNAGSTGQQFGDRRQQRFRETQLEKAMMRQDERLQKRQLTAETEAARISAARSAASAAEISPYEDAEMSVQNFLQAAIEDPEGTIKSKAARTGVPGYREFVKKKLNEAYGTKIGAGRIEGLINRYFPDKWEDLHGLPRG